MKRGVALALPVWLLLWLLLWASTAHAEDVERAKALFAAGAAAYDKHDYVGAIRAFEGAQHAAPRPPIVFSLAQAHRRQFYVDGNLEHQHVAVDLFRDYVKQVPSGGRHEDAMRALQELGALAPQRDATSVSINSSGTPNARVALDGAPPVAVPLIGPVSPGKHHAIISAEGFTTEERDIVAVEGQIIPLDVPLKEKAARLSVASPSGAHVEIDGRVVGETPLSTIETTRGPHVVAISMNGHEGYLHEVDLARGEERRLEAPLPATKQRKVAIGFLVAGGVTVVAAAVFAGLAASYLGQAQGVLNKAKTVNLGPEDQSSYDFARDAHTNWLTAAGASFAGAGVFAVTGLVLFVFDRPQMGGAATRDEQRAKPVEHKVEPTEISIVPIVSPTTMGAAAVMRF